jgi:hypothetical protein
MSSLTQNRWFRRLGVGAVAALSLFAITTSNNPAQAHSMVARAPVVAMHHVSYVPRFFFGGYGWHHWYHHWR